MTIKIDESLGKFISSLEKPTVAKTLRTIDLLEKFGPFLGVPHSKKINPYLFELRIRGQQEIRIFYAFQSKQIILLHGFIKKSPKTPAKEIKTAQDRLRLLTKI